MPQGYSVSTACFHVTPLEAMGLRANKIGKHQVVGRSESRQSAAWCVWGHGKTLRISTGCLLIMEPPERGVGSARGEEREERRRGE